MPVPSKRLKELTEGTVDHHASLTHPDLQEITVRWRGSFGYMDAWAGKGTTATSGSRSAASSTSATRPLGIRDLRPRHRDLRRRHPGNRAPHRPPNDAYDTAALVHLADYKK